MVSFEELKEKLERYYAATGFRFSFYAFIALMFAFATVGAIGSLVIVQLLPTAMRQSGPILAMAAFVAILSLIVGIPITIRNNRIASIEKNLPDALKHMALVLKSGGTTEGALEEAANADYGPLSDDLKLGLKRLKEGKSFDEILKDIAMNSGSILFARTSSLIIDARKAGAGLADVMNAISDEARDLIRITRERKSRTMMHVLFLVVSGLLLSPFIFGFTMSIVSFMSSGISASGGFGDGSVTANVTIADCRKPCLMQIDPIMGTFLAAGLAPLDQPAPMFEWRLQAMDQMLMLFLAAMAIITLVAISVIRDGHMFKFIIYFPFGVMAVIVIYLIGKLFSGLIIGPVS